MGTTIADGSGNWSITTGVLTDATHILTATTIDVAGNASAASPALTISIDTTDPAAPSAPDLAAASDSGSSSTDDITSNTTPIIAGTAEANATVILTSDLDGALLPRPPMVPVTGR